MGEKVSKTREGKLVGVNETGPVVETSNGDSKTLIQLSKVEHGKPVPLGTSLVSVGDDKEKGMPYVQIEDVYRAKSTSSGPPKVSTNAYREGWQRIFGIKEADPKVVN